MFLLPVTLVSEYCGNTGNEAEIFFLDDAQWHTDIANGFAINHNGLRDDSLNHGVAKVIQNAGEFQGATGFGFYDGGPNGELDELGKGLYKLSSGGHYLYYDLRSCRDTSISPDIMINTAPFSFYFCHCTEANTCNLSNGDTIRLSWLYLPHEIYETHDLSLFGNPTDYTCFETSITFSQKYNEETLNGEFVEKGFIPMFQVGSQDFICRTVHQIPVINIGDVTQIEFVDFLLFLFVTSGKPLDQHQEGEEPYFMKVGLQQGGCHRQWNGFKLPYRLPNDRYLDTQKAVTFAIFTFSGFEKALGVGSNFRIRE